ncbi:MAG: hypothetical protein CSA75_04805, partial [Sorangium cellulosum]
MPSEGSSASDKRPYIGGQAVIEGVMMRSPRSFSVVVRRCSGSLMVQEQPMLNARKSVQAWPFFRGVFSLFEALQWGSQALRFSAEQYESDLKAKEEAVRKSATISNLFS